MRMLVGGALFVVGMALLLKSSDSGERFHFPGFSIELLSTPRITKFAYERDLWTSSLVVGWEPRPAELFHWLERVAARPGELRITEMRTLPNGEVKAHGVADLRWFAARIRTCGGRSIFLLTRHESLREAQDLVDQATESILCLPDPVEEAKLIR